MLRISLIEPAHHPATLRLEGSLAGPWVNEARRACDGILASGSAPRLQLAEVDFVDAAGVALLNELRLRGVSFVDSSPFITEQLKASAR